MAFTTQVFIFVFFPICVLAYYLTILLQKSGLLAKALKKIRATDLVLIGISCVFYLWTCFDDVFRLLIYVAFIYGLGLLIQRYREKNYVPLIMLGSAALVISILIHFKYTNMIASVWNFLFKDTVSGKSIIAPIGISFITFSAISYLADIYWGKAKGNSLLDCALYLTFFPKVVSGPIVLWRDFQKQIDSRRIDLDLLSRGVNRIMIGFVKKLVLADTFGACIASCSNAVDGITAWGISLIYMLQIYYDFSGYSDVAIGLANMFGFEFKENFNFPYLSLSITEFWRRWHISLGTWFREYIYFPLGGSRKGKKSTIINIGIVFLLTGIWHGAGWTYMLWGILNGICNIIEKLLKDKKFYVRTPKVIKWLITMVIVFFSWELFRFESFSACKEWLLVMFGIRNFTNIPYGWQYYFDARMISLSVVGILGATIWGIPKLQEIYQKGIKTHFGYLVNECIIVILFVVAILFMINSNYSPFIYFQY